MTAADRRALWLLLLAALVILGAGLGLRDPWPADEPRYALVAKQMVESGDWLFPRRGSELYHDKPPLLMWAQALCYLLIGQWRVAFLLPSLLAGLGTLALIWDLGCRLWSPRVGLLAAVTVLATVMFTYQFKRAQIDPLVTFLITLANWALVRHLLLGPHWHSWWLGCFAAGLGVITKGVGVIALFMLLPWLAAVRAGWPAVARPTHAVLPWGLGVLAFFAPIALWLVPMVTAAWWRDSPEYMAYVQDILIDQTARRYAGSVGGHAKPWWYFLPVLLLHFFPLSLLYVAGWRDWREAWRRRDARVLVLLGWCGLVLLFFSLAGGKREVYLLPMLPMLALALGPTLARALDTCWLRSVALGSTVIFGVAFAGAATWALTGRWVRMGVAMFERGITGDEARLLWILVAAVGVAFLASAMVMRLRRGVHAFLAAAACLWFIWGLAIAPLLNGAASAAAVMREADRIAGPDGEIGLVAWKEQNLLMSPRPATDFGFAAPHAVQFMRATLWQGEDPQRRWIFALSAAVRDCVDPGRITAVGYANRREWWMYRAEAVRPGCTPEQAFSTVPGR